MYLKDLHDVQLQNHHRIMQQLDVLEYRTSVGPSEYIFPLVDVEALKSFDCAVHKQGQRMKLTS